MSCIYIRVISSDMLQGSIEDNIPFSSIILTEPNMDGLQSAISARLGTQKPVTVLDGLRDLGSDVSMWFQWSFLVYQGANTVYMSFVEPTDDGLARAQLSIQHHINLE